MRAVIQRVKNASVEVANEEIGAIKKGLLIYLGIDVEDEKTDVEYLSKKISQLRIFSDDAGKMNLNVSDAGGSVLVISQFTLFADTSKGNRPSFIRSAKPDKAIPLYELFKANLTLRGISVASGKFGADMQVAYINDGPVTIIMDSKNR